MELWIRSQDRKYLTKCDGLYIIKSDNDGKITYKIMINFIDLGIYETEKRALEILDEIQKKINLINLCRDIGSPVIDLNNPAYIYEMPKE